MKVIARSLLFGLVAAAFAGTALAQYFPAGGPASGPTSPVSVSTTSWKEVLRHSAKVDGGTSQRECTHDPLFGDFCVEVHNSEVRFSSVVPAGAGHLEHRFSATGRQGTLYAVLVSKEQRPDGSWLLTAAASGVANGDQVVRLQSRRTSGASFTFPAGSVSLGTYVHAQ